jgi:hypothetical protein
MAIINYEERTYNRLIGRECFYCYGPVYPPGVMWMGSGGDLVLHPPCVLELYLRLGRDVLQIEQTTGQYFAAGDMHKLRTRLVASEMQMQGASYDR